METSASPTNRKIRDPKKGSIGFKVFYKEQWKICQNNKNSRSVTIVQNSRQCIYFNNLFVALHNIVFRRNNGFHKVSKIFQNPVFLTLISLDIHRYM